MLSGMEQQVIIEVTAWGGAVGHYFVNNNLMFQLSEALTFYWIKAINDLQ